MKQELKEKSNVIKNKIVVNPRLINVNSFLAKDGLTIYFKRDNKFWKDCSNLTEISRDFFYNELRKILNEINLYFESLNEAIAKLKKDLELNYLKELTRNEFRIFKFLRDNGRYDNNLVQIIIGKRKITKFSDMILTPDRVAAIGLINDLENILLDFIQLNFKIKSFTQSYNSLWIPKEAQAIKILELNNVEGYNFFILNNALKHLNYCSCMYLDSNAILYLKKVELVIAIAPKYMTSKIT